MSTTKQILEELQASISRVQALVDKAQHLPSRQFKPWTVAEAESYWREQIAREIEDFKGDIGDDFYGNTIDEGTKYPEYGDGWCSATGLAAAIARGK